MSSSNPPTSSGSGPPLTADQISALKQVEFLVSDSNLPFDAILYALHSISPGWIPVSAIMGHPTMQRWEPFGESWLSSILRSSSKLLVNPQGTAVQRVASGLTYDLAKLLQRTVYVAGFLVDPTPSQEHLTEHFSQWGTVECVRMMNIDGKFQGSLTCEFKTAEEAANLVKTPSRHVYDGRPFTVVLRGQYLATIAKEISTSPPDPTRVLPYGIRWSAFAPSSIVKSERMTTETRLAELEEAQASLRCLVLSDSDPLAQDVHILSSNREEHNQRLDRHLVQYETIISVANKGAADIKTRKNSYNIVSRLPIEIFQVIIYDVVCSLIWSDDGLRHPDAPAFYQVLQWLGWTTRQWQEMIDGSHLLWTHFFVGDSERVWKEALAKSGNQAIHLDADLPVEDHQLHLFLKTVGTSKRDIESFTTNYNALEHGDAAIAPFRKFLLSPSPKMSSLKINFRSSKYLAIGKLFHDQAPTLRHVEMQGSFRVAWTTVGLQGLLSLRLSGEHFDPAARPTADELLDVLSASPQLKSLVLECLELRILEPKKSRHQPHNPPPRTCDLLQLKEFTFRSMPSSSVTTVLLSISAPQCRRTLVTFSNMGPATQQVDPAAANHLGGLISSAITSSVGYSRLEGLALELMDHARGLVFMDHSFIWDEPSPQPPDTLNLAARDTARTITLPIILRIPAELRELFTLARVGSDAMHASSHYNFPRVHSNPALHVLNTAFPNIRTLALEFLGPIMERDLAERRAVDFGSDGTILASRWNLPRMERIGLTYPPDEESINRIINVVRRRNSEREQDATLSEITHFVLRVPVLTLDIAADEGPLIVARFDALGLQTLFDWDQKDFEDLPSESVDTGLSGSTSPGTEPNNEIVQT